MSKKSMKRRAADEMKDVVKEIAARRQVAAPHADTLEIGSVYAGSDGHSYELTSIMDQNVTAKRDGKKIPFPRAMFEELVGIGDADAMAANAEKAASIEVARKAERAAAKEVAEAKAAATAVAAKKAKEVRKSMPARGDRAVSGMWVIRTTLAKDLDATVEDISKACDAAGVPKSNSTIATIMSDFKQTYAALADAGRIAKA